MYLTGFADEVSSNIDDQIRVTKELGWNAIEARSIGESNIHDIEKEWKKLMKSWHGKVDEKKHEFFADDVNLKSMGDN